MAGSFVVGGFLGGGFYSEMVFDKFGVFGVWAVCSDEENSIGRAQLLN
jgi:hypothetical protein